jgi:hypothetical protein
MQQVWADSGFSSKHLRMAHNMPSSKHSRASSTEPDSDAAVVPSQQHQSGRANAATSGSHRPDVPSSPLHPHSSSIEVTAHHQQHPTPRHFQYEATTPRAAGGGAAGGGISAAPTTTTPVGKMQGTAVSMSLDEQDYDTWLEAALATQTFDRDNADGNNANGVEEEVEPGSQSLTDWLNSVIP